MLSEIVLIAGPFVRASSWAPTAEYLHKGGYNTQLPDVLANLITPPAWRDWTSYLINLILPAEELILVGHSSASPLVADLASKLQSRAIIIVDGHIPPAQGLAEPTRPALRDLIKRLAAPSDLLPIWSEWFRGDKQREALIGLDRLAENPLIFADFESELRRFPVSWVDDSIQLVDWSGSKAGFIQTSPIYDYAADEAERRGWPVTKIQGTHMHPMLEPAETAAAIISMIHQLVLPPEG